MAFNIQIPMGNNQVKTVGLEIGETLFVVGPNGSGKSTLMSLIAKAHVNATRRVSAQRQNWWSEVNMTPAARRNLETNSRSWDANLTSRYLEQAAENRAQAAIFDLVNFNDVRSREIASAVDCGDLPEAQRLSRKPSPIAVLNDLFRLSNIAVQIKLEGDELFAVRGGSRFYTLQQLSDGERNSLLLVSTVLTAQAGLLILIDEPERHLHRSIISPLLRLLFAQRPDCSFVISTHEVNLPAETPNSHTVLLRSFDVARDGAYSFVADVASSPMAIDDQLKRDILGARRTMIFVEGDVQSLDRPIYSLVFPNTSVIPKGSCADVEHAVAGIRGTADLHWIKAVGIVDGDRRSTTEVAKLKAKGVFPISVLAIESVYYHTDVQRLVAERQTKLDGSDLAARLAAAKVEALKQIAPHADRLSRRGAERAIRDAYLMQAPGKKEVDSQQWHSTSMHIPSYVGREKARLDAAIVAGNLNEIIQHYPVRTTPALKSIAVELGFQDREHYEAAVRKLLLDDANSLALVKGMFGDVVADVA